MPRRSVVRRAMDAVARPPVRALSKLLLDLSVSGTDHVPAEGGFILASNHFSHLDPPLLQLYSGHDVRFLAVDELFGKSMFLDAALKHGASIPLDRDGYPVAAMREAIEHIEGGNSLGLFPEGRRVERWGVGDPKRGAAWLSWMTGAPLIPVAIHGTQHTLSPADRGLHRTAVRIWYEPPLWWHNYSDRLDPVGSMTADWFDAVDRRLSDWMET